MNQEVLRFFNLSSYPFTKEIATDKLLELPATQSRLAGLKVLIDTRGIGVLTGKSGTGESCVLRLLLKELHTGLYKPLYFSHTSVGVQEFYSHLADTSASPPLRAACAWLKSSSPSSAHFPPPSPLIDGRCYRLLIFVRRLVRYFYAVRPPRRLHAGLARAIGHGKSLKLTYAGAQWQRGKWKQTRWCFSSTGRNPTANYSKPTSPKQCHP